MIQDDVFLHLDGAARNIDLHLKMEGLNPAGSIKLKTALGMVEDAERRGVLRPGCRLVESSSGSLGIALAVISAAKGYRFLCVTDPNTSALSAAAMRALGADVVEVGGPDANGGYLGSRIAYIHERLAADPELVWLNQYANPANWEVHARRTAAAITAALPDTDYLFVGTGTTGTLMGCVHHFRRHAPHTRIIAVDAVGSVTFDARAAPRYIPGIGTSRRPEILRRDLVDDVELVEEADTVRTCRWLARRYGLFAGGSTGSVVHAVLRRAPQLPPGSRVVAISPDFGERYVRTIYDDDWVAGTYGPDALVEPHTPLSALTTVRN
ncbi:2,3-diaminopropionate biosynthesis protein SbnA [Actinacidiphila guanduensis]|uniref:Cysteine synthase A n=1 Tax=Actinacidiphila guanduensis TaxID=310781 RepID=A0A1H0BPM0_9ACTN|nr:2,3-diaminopropionate biosynthesis protein SbnA [Actinacidiphila guanduensis]SDN47609.1 cysteine synthase A [Actinacidiphila guanduensis]